MYNQALHNSILFTFSKLRSFSRDSISSWSIFTFPFFLINMIPSSLESSMATPKIICLALDHVESCVWYHRYKSYICVLPAQKYLLRTCTVIPSVFQPFQPIDEQIQDLLSFLWSQTVHVSENTAHDSVYSIFQFQINWRLSRN